MTTDFTFAVDEAARTIIIDKGFAAPRQRVWDYYTKANLLDRWFAPKPLTTKTKFMDFREGGHWHFAMIDPGGTEYWNRIDYETISPVDGFTARDGFCDASGTVNPDMPRSHWDVQFVDQGTTSRVRTVVSYASAEEIAKVVQMGVEAGMASTYERLDELLASAFT